MKKIEWEMSALEERRRPLTSTLQAQVEDAPLLNVADTPPTPVRLVTELEWEAAAGGARGAQRDG